MKARWLFLAGVATVSLAGVALVQAPQPLPPPLAELEPPGPLLYLEAKDFASLVHDWQTSPEKRLWLQSDNYAVFSRSRLYLRLDQVQKEFAEAAGFPPNMSLVDSVAGAESALALYDIGKLQFLYITRMPSARALETVLGRQRGNYEPRSAADLPYFVRVEPTSGRLVAFATTDDYLLLATREDLLAGALTLLAARNAATNKPRPASGGTLLSVKDEHWFAQSLDAAQRSKSHAGSPDLRLVLNMKSLVLSPYFRSYWVQRNVSTLRPYETAICDLYRSATQIREEREFLHSQSLSQPATGEASNGASDDAADVDGLVRLVPDDAGFYRAWTKPRVEEALDLLGRKVLAPRAQASVAATIAPALAVSPAGPGSETDLEVRIDEAPFAPQSREFNFEPLRKLFESTQLRALLQVQSSRAMPDHVLVENDSVVVLVAASEWDGDAARRALQSAVEGLWTTSRFGISWVQRNRGAATGIRASGFEPRGSGSALRNPDPRTPSPVVYELDGLAGIAMAARGRYLIVASTGEALGKVLDRMAANSGSGIRVREPRSQNPEARLWYAVGFRHAQERETFYRTTRLIDNVSEQLYGQPVAPGGRQPQFFSGNIGSLSRTLARVQSVSIVVRHTGASESQTVTYELGR